ncbi:MAG: DUF4956 domain-containing protein [Butyricicoccus sp.]
MLETIFGSILTAGLTGSAFVICLLVALALGALVAAVYMYKNTYTQSMAVTLALLPAMVQVIILLVNGNLGAGVAVSGAFSLVRFRYAAGCARDITCIFLAMTLGLATGIVYRRCHCHRRGDVHPADRLRGAVLRKPEEKSENHHSGEPRLHRPV